MKKAGLFKPAFLFLNMYKLLLEFVLYDQVCPGNAMVRGNAFDGIIFHSNLVIYARGKDEVAAKVDVGRDAHNEIGPVTGGITAVWSGVNTVVPDQLSMEVEGLLGNFRRNILERQGIIEHKNVGKAGSAAAVRVGSANHCIGH